MCPIVYLVKFIILTKNVVLKSSGFELWQAIQCSPLNFLESTTAKNAVIRVKYDGTIKTTTAKKNAVVNEIYDGKIKSKTAEFVVQVFAHIVLTIATFNRKSSSNILV